MHQVLLRAEAEHLSNALDFLKAARELATALTAQRVQIYDPVPMTLTRRASLERAQLMLESPSRPALQAFLGEWTMQLYDLPGPRVRWSLDVDPIEF
jgi:primosomal protein N' (replication factor Y)